MGKEAPTPDSTSSLSVEPKSLLWISQLPCPPCGRPWGMWGAEPTPFIPKVWGEARRGTPADRGHPSLCPGRFLSPKWNLPQTQRLTPQPRSKKLRPAPPPVRARSSWPPGKPGTRPVEGGRRRATRVASAGPRRPRSHCLHDFPLPTPTPSGNPPNTAETTRPRLRRPHPQTPIGSRSGAFQSWSPGSPGGHFPSPPRAHLPASLRACPGPPPRRPRGLRPAGRPSRGPSPSPRVLPVPPAVRRPPGPRPLPSCPAQPPSTPDPEVPSPLAPGLPALKAQAPFVWAPPSPSPEAGAESPTPLPSSGVGAQEAR